MLVYSSFHEAKAALLLLIVVLIWSHSEVSYSGLLLRRHTHHHILLGRHSHHHHVWLLLHPHHHIWRLLHGSHLGHRFIVKVLLRVHVTSVISRGVKWATLYSLSLALSHSGRFVCLNRSCPDIIERVGLFALKQVATYLVLIHLLLLFLCLHL